MAGLGGLLGMAGIPGMAVSAGLMGPALFNANQTRHDTDFARGEGDPYRSQLRALQGNPDLYLKGPEAQSLARMLDQRYSAQFGNPAGSGTAQALASDALLRGLGAEKDRLFKMGGGDYINANMGPAKNAYNKANMGIFGSLMDIIGGVSGMGGMGGGGGGAGGAAGGNLGGWGGMI